MGVQQDAVGNPETAVRRESSGTKGVADGHFPGEECQRELAIYVNVMLGSERTTCQRGAGRDHHSQTPEGQLR